jgi:hypothetical protein
MSEEDFMFKKLAICSFTAVMFGTGSVALAHTGVKDTGIEGKGLYTAFTIGHGCDSATNTIQLPVIAQSVVFPNAADSVWTKLDATGAPVGNLAISDVIQGAAFALAPGLVQDKNVFSIQQKVLDSLSNVRGFHLKGGKLQADLIGLIPFKVTAPKFVVASCVKSLKVRIAVANWCKTIAQNNANLADKDRRADFWLGKATTKFNDPAVIEVIANWTATPPVAPYWPTLTINRDLVANPMDASCNGGYDVAVEPSSADIDANLPIAGYPLGKI